MRYTELREYINPNKYFTVMFDKNGGTEVESHGESKLDAYTYASDMPGIGAVIIRYNRETKATRIARADFNVDIARQQQLQMKKTALNLVSNQP